MKSKFDKIYENITEDREFNSFCEESFDEGFVSKAFDSFEGGERMLRNGWKNFKKVMGANGKKAWHPIDLAKILKHRQENKDKVIQAATEEIEKFEAGDGGTTLFSVIERVADMTQALPINSSDQKALIKKQKDFKNDSNTKKAFKALFTGQLKNKSVADKLAYAYILLFGEMKLE